MARSSVPFPNGTSIPDPRVGRAGLKTDMWWEAPKSKIGESVRALADSLYEDAQGVRDQALHHARLYSNRMASSLYGKDFTNAVDGGSRIRMNLTRSVIDTATAQIATQRTRPMYLTEDGNIEQKDRARKRGKLVTGWFHVLKIFIEALSMFRDAGIWSLGCLQFSQHNGRIYMERVLQDEYLVDETESRTGRVRTLARRSSADRSVLIAMYPEQEKKILAAGWSHGDEDDSHDAVGMPDPCTRYEAWHLPTLYGSEDGRHVICLDNVVLVDEPWKRPTFPVVLWRWAESVIGFRGNGLAEELSSLQLEINWLAQKIQTLMTLATTTIWLEKGSYSGKIDNTDMAQRYYTGRPPVFMGPVSASAEFFGQLDRLWSRGHEIGGISLMAATSNKPAGLDSGEALRVYNDIGSRRFFHTGQRWENMFLECAEQIMGMASDIVAAGGKDARILGCGDHDMETLSYDDVSLDPDTYVLKAWPVSIIPDTPAGKIEALKAMAAFAPSLASYLLATVSGIPDLEHAVSLANAPLEMAEMTVENILRHGEYVKPHPANNLVLMRDVAQRSLLRAFLQRVPTEKTALLGRLISDIDDMQSTAAAAGMGPIGGNTPAPAGMPVDITAGVPGMPQIAQNMQGSPAPMMPGGM